jgi:hypothetical protein
MAKWIWEHKKEAAEIAVTVRPAVKWVVGKFRRNTLAALSDQIDYLLESADDEAERRVAGDWRREIDVLRRGYELARHAPTRAKRRSERKHLDARLEQLRLLITDAYAEERIEDQGGPQSGWAGDVRP